jgi:lia operon protein LiaG
MTRRPSRRALLGTAGAAVIGAISGCVSIGSGVSEEFERSYEANDLTVQGRVGDLRVDRTDREDVLVEGEKHANDEDELDQLGLEADSDGERLVLRVENDADTGALLFGSTPKFDLEVTVPATTTIDSLSTNTGDLTAETGPEPTSVETDTGDIRVADGSVDVRTNTGEVETEESAMPTEIRSDTGDVMIRNGSTLQQVDTDTGGVTVAFPSLDGDVSIMTETGDISISLLADLDVTADADTSTGDVDRSGLEFEDVVQGSGRFEGTLGAGTHGLSVQSSTGDVRISALN